MSRAHKLVTRAYKSFKSERDLQGLTDLGSGDFNVDPLPNDVLKP